MIQHQKTMPKPNESLTDSSSSSTSIPSIQSSKAISKGEEMGRAALKSLGAPSTFSPPPLISRPAAISTPSYSSQSNESTNSSSSAQSSSSFFESPASSSFSSSPALVHAAQSQSQQQSRQSSIGLKFSSKEQASSSDQALPDSASSFYQISSSSSNLTDGIDSTSHLNYHQTVAPQSSQQQESNQRPILPFQFDVASSSSSSAPTASRESFLRYSPRQTSTEWNVRGSGQDIEVDGAEERRPYSSETVSSGRTVTDRDQYSTPTNLSAYDPPKGHFSFRTLPDRRNRSIDEVSSTQWFNPPILPQPRGSLPSSIYSPNFGNPSFSTFQHQSSPILGASPRGRNIAPLPRISPTPASGMTVTHSGQFVASPSPSLSDSIMRDASQSRSRSGSQASGSGLGLDYASYPPSPRRSLAELRNPLLERERGERQVYGNNFGSLSGKEFYWATPASADKRRWSADELVEAARAKTEKLEASQDEEMKDVLRSSGSPGKKRGSDADRQDSADTIGRSRGFAPTPPTREEIMSRLQSKVKERLAAKSMSKKTGQSPSPMPSTPSSASTSVSPSPRLAAEAVFSTADPAMKYQGHYQHQYQNERNSGFNRSPSLQDLSIAAANTSSSSTSYPSSSSRTRLGKSKMNSLPLPPRPNPADGEQRAALGIETLLNAAHAADHDHDGAG